MGTLASNRKGYIQGPSSSSYEDALTASTGTAYYAQSGNVAAAIQYFKSTGRGGGTYRFTRTFIHFDTSGISGGSSFQLTVTSTAGNSSDGNYNVIGVNHDGGNANGGELEGGDFDSINKSTKWSSSTAWGSSGTITISLNAAAATQIINNSNFNIALLLKSDADDEEEDPLESSGNISDGIAFGSAISLTYTDPASGYANTVNNVAGESIGKINTVAAANIGKVNTVA